MRNGLYQDARPSSIGTSVPTPVVDSPRSFPEMHRAQDHINDRLQAIVTRLAEINYRLLGQTESGPAGLDDASAKISSDVAAMFSRQSRSRELLERIEQSLGVLETV